VACARQTHWHTQRSRVHVMRHDDANDTRLPIVTTAAPAGSKSNPTLPPFNTSKHFAYTALDAAMGLMTKFPAHCSPAAEHCYRAVMRQVQCASDAKSDLADHVTQKSTADYHRCSSPASFCPPHQTPSCTLHHSKSKREISCKRATRVRHLNCSGVPSASAGAAGATACSRAQAQGPASAGAPASLPSNQGTVQVRTLPDLEPNVRFTTRGREPEPTVSI
jgi:hypothetical protein